MRPTLRTLPRITLATLIALAPIHLSAQTHRPIVSKSPPTYPELARRMRISGKVVLIVMVQPDGSVSDTHAESGHAMLVPAAQDAVRHWRFAPAPDASETTVEINFTDTAH